MRDDLPRPDVIETARLRLRRAQPADLMDLHGILTRPDAMRYWSRPPHETLEATQIFLRDMIEAPASVADDFVIEHEGRAVGKAGAWRLPEVGILLHPGLWGLGLAREALEAAIGHLFSWHGMDALTAEADPRNARSLGLLTRLGFRETGRAERTMQWGQEWCDSVYLTLDARDPHPRG